MKTAGKGIVKRLFYAIMTVSTRYWLFRALRPRWDTHKTPGVP